MATSTSTSMPSPDVDVVRNPKFWPKAEICLSRVGRASFGQAQTPVSQTLIMEDAVRSIRPGFGLAPKFLEEVVGRVVSCDVKKATAVNWELLK